MNFLGHLYFSDNDHELMYCNLYGDSVKGKDLSKYPIFLANGITLHRSIDSYIDTHPKVLELRHELSPKLNKVSSIAIDLYFDHLLAKNWSKYSTIPFRKFCDDFKLFHSEYETYFNEDFLFLLDKLKKEDWIYNYQFPHGLEFACKGLSRRIKFKNDLYKAPEIYFQLEESITFAFENYMEDAIPHFKKIIESIKGSI